VWQQFKHYSQRCLNAVAFILGVDFMSCCSQQLACKCRTASYCCWEVWWCTKLNTNPIRWPEGVGSLVESRYWNTCNEDKCSCFSFSMCSDFIQLFLSTSAIEGINSLRYTFTYSVCHCKFTVFKFHKVCIAVWP